MTTSQPSAASTRAVAAFTCWKKTCCTQPESMPTRRRRLPRPLTTCAGRPCRKLAGTRGNRASMCASRFGQKPQQATGAEQLLQAGALVEQHGQCQQAQALHVREGGEEELAEQAIGGGARYVAFDLGARVFDELVVLRRRRGMRSCRPCIRGNYPCAGGNAGRAEPRPGRTSSSCRCARGVSPSLRPRARMWGRQGGRSRSARNHRSERFPAACGHRNSKALLVRAA